MELAETAAVGRTLSDAGFGLQFADREGDLDPEVTEAPMERRMLQGGSIRCHGIRGQVFFQGDDPRGKAGLCSGCPAYGCLDASYENVFGKLEE